MIHFENIEQYKENNRIEAKKAVGGLPHSIWETYSAFANTMGGIILLGVEEYRDKTFHTVKLPDPEALIEDFLVLLNDPKKVNRNILSETDITIEEADGKKLVAIRVPRAKREERPIYIDGDPMTGTYRRNGDGDYRVTPEELHTMMREASTSYIVKKQPRQERILEKKKQIVSYLTENITASCRELAAHIDISEENTQEMLSQMISHEILEAYNGIYQLKT